MGGSGRVQAKRSLAKPDHPASQAPIALEPAQRIDQYLADLGDWRGARLAEIRQLILEANSKVVEDWKWMGSPVWSYQGMFAVANAHKDKVKVTFSHGAQLSDPKGLFNAGLTGNKWRAIDLREGDKLPKTAFKALVREALAYNAQHTVPNSKGSRAVLLEKAPPTRKVTPAKASAKKGSPLPPPSQPVLLAGGNPQIAKADGDAPVQTYIAAMPGWKRDVGRQLDALITRTVPNVRKAVRWNTPFYGAGEQGWFLGFHCVTKYVKVAFFRGTSLSPLPPVESKQKGVRYLHIHEGDAIDAKLVAKWIQQSATLPGWKP
ncbi:MAG TPA: DUF1801 domain-containing protein [Planctomycetota bacterium]|nr:DUF1801 domain-containing protein [Planctomycetota bacterium]